MAAPSPARRNAMLNGALVGMGAVAVLDTVVVHWILDLHRTFDGPTWAVLSTEIATVALGVALVVIGVWREAAARPVE